MAARRSLEIDELLDGLAKLSHKVVELNSLKGSLLKHIEVIPDHLEVFLQVSLGSGSKETKVGSENLHSGLSSVGFPHHKVTGGQTSVLIGSLDCIFLNHFLSESVAGVSLESSGDDPLVGLSPVAKRPLVALEAIIAGVIHDLAVLLFDFGLLDLEENALGDVGD